MRNIFWKFLFFLFLTLNSLGSGVVYARIINVPADFSTIAGALRNSNDNDFINIAPGRYYEVNLVMEQSVTLNGAGQSPEDVIIEGSSHSRILWCESMTSSSTIQNITFANGNASGEAVYDQSGGAILISNCSPRIFNCHFINNNATASGGALRCSHASPQIIGCTFTNNSASGGGGAIDCSYNSSPLILNCYFENNRARWGGGLSCRGDASPSVSDCNFNQNNADGFNLGFGGAVFADYQAKPDFLNCTFYGNEGNFGGAIACFDDSQTNLNHCTLVENSAILWGGGLFSKNSSPIITMSIFTFQAGTAISSSGSGIPDISYTDIFGNRDGDWIDSIADQLGKSNVSVDPMFCESDPTFAFGFYLSEDSPLGPLYVEGGPMGAWSVGCDPTATTLNFQVIWANSHPRITWSVGNNALPQSYRLTRSILPHVQLEEEIPFTALGNNEYLAIDTESWPVPQRQYNYRLYLLEHESGWVLVDEITLNSESANLYNLQVQAYPNPFNPNTTIHFALDKPQHIKVSIHDLRGNRIVILEDALLETGDKSIPWDGCDTFGHRVGSGAYFVIIQGESITQSKKIMLIE